MIKYHFLKYVKSLWSVILVCIVASTSSFAQPKIEVSSVTQVFRNIAVITDTSTIQVIFDEFLIPEFLEETEKIEILDVAGIGFGTFDILIVYPSIRVYLLENTNPDLANIMRNWSISELRRDASNNLDATYFYPAYADTLQTPIPSNLQADLVTNALLADILESLERNYKIKPISFRFERDEEGFTYQIWNHESEAFQFSPRPILIGNKIGTSSDNKITGNSIARSNNSSEFIFITKTIEDSVFLPQAIQREYIKEFRNCDICSGPIYESNTRKRTFQAGFYTLFIPKASFNSSFDFGAGFEMGLLVKPAHHFFKFGLGSSIIPTYSTSDSNSNSTSGAQSVSTNTRQLNTNLQMMSGFYWRSGSQLGGYFSLGSRFQTQFYTEPTPTKYQLSGFVEAAIEFNKISTFLRSGILRSRNATGYHEFGISYALKRFRIKS